MKSVCQGPKEFDRAGTGIAPGDVIPAALPFKGQSPDQSKEFPSPELCGGFVYVRQESLADLVN
jgi:hypothetical protein